MYVVLSCERKISIQNNMNTMSYQDAGIRYSFDVYGMGNIMFLLIY